MSIRELQPTSLHVMVKLLLASQRSVRSCSIDTQWNKSMKFSVVKCTNGVQQYEFMNDDFLVLQKYWTEFTHEMKNFWNIDLVLTNPNWLIKASVYHMENLISLSSPSPCFSFRSLWWITFADRNHQFTNTNWYNIYRALSFHRYKVPQTNLSYRKLSRKFITIRKPIEIETKHCGYVDVLHNKIILHEHKRNEMKKGNSNFYCMHEAKHLE